MKKHLLLILFLFSFSIYNAQSLKDKIGQMVWVGFSGTKLNDTIKIDLSKRNVGGIILFANNISNPSQIKSLNDSIKLFSKTLPFIAVDQEGGKVARLNSTNGFKDTYTAYRLGTIFNSLDSTRKTAEMMATWLKQSGFNVNLAPVADVNVNPNSPAIAKLERSFSDNPLLVFNHINVFVEEFNKKGIITCLKHFPGHGSATQDSHLGFTDITNTWTQNELIPFQKLIDNNYNNMIMTGHIYNSKIDSNFPASLSSLTATKLLKQDLKFNGVTITDAMNMQAITSNYSFEDAIIFAVNAGNDIILNTGTLRFGTSLASQVINVIYNNVLNGKISNERINESYNKIIELKRNYGIITSLESYSEIPKNFQLYQNFPNPFNGETIINYKLSKPSFVVLKIFNSLGQEIKILKSEFQSSGFYTVHLDFSIESLPTGVYYFQLKTNENQETKKMVYLK